MLFSFQICLPWIWLDGIFFSFPCNEKCFIPFTFTSTLVSMVWVDYILVGNDKCLTGRKLCRMMHKVINVYGFMPKVEVLSKKKIRTFFPSILSLTNAYDYVQHACLKSGRRKWHYGFFKLFFLFYFQSCCQIRLHWTRRTIRRTILDRITEDLEEEKMGLDSKQLNNTRDIKYFIILFFNLNVTSYNYNNITFIWFYYQHYFYRYQL